MSGPRPSAVPTDLTIPECTCPGSPHPDGDTAVFRPHLTWDGGIAAVSAMTRAKRSGAQEVDDAVEREVGIVLIVHGIESWNLLDAEGNPRPITEEAVKALPWAPTAYSLWDRATDLYAMEVLNPLARSLPAFSLNGQTGRSTSARKTPRKPKRASTPSLPAVSAGSEK